MLINTSNNPITTLAVILTSVGAINWGLIGAFNFNLVEFLTGGNITLSKIVYTVVGISGIYTLFKIGSLLSSPNIKKAD